MPSTIKTKQRKIKKAVVFGGSGFLGSHVADALTESGCEVIVFDKKSSPYLQKGQTMVVGDILDGAQIRKVVRGCDAVYNFAGIASLDDAATKPLDTVTLNVAGNIHILDACLEHDISRVVYASSIYVYSDKGGFYRCSKQASEIYIEEYQRRYGLDYTILRYGTLYGPRADKRNSVYRYLKQAMEKKCVDCAGTGEEVRDYVYVKDAARLSVEILDPKYRNQHLIISGHHPIQFKEMIKVIGEILGAPVKLKLKKEAVSAHYSYTPYSFSPKIGFKLTNHLYLDMGQGLLETIQAIHEELGAAAKS